jgi:DtxR family Mn-dependent transcriptional regulator
MEHTNRELSQSFEDYLKTIGLLVRAGTVRVTDIASNLCVSKPSVVTALKTMKNKGLLEHECYRTVILTKQGQGKETEIRKRYNFLLFLRKAVGVSLETTKNDACKMEHIISEETFMKMKNFIQA